MSDLSPSAQIIAAASQTTVITDATGRKLTLRSLNVLDQARLLRAIGPEQSKNEPYVNLVQAAASVTDIDGIPLPFIANERQIDASISRVGDAGYAAIMVHLRKQMADLEAAAVTADAEANATSPLQVSAS